MDFEPENINRFLDKCTSMGMSENTTKAYCADLMGFDAWKAYCISNGNDVLPTMRPEMAVATYLNVNRSKWAPSTTKRKLACFRAYARFMGEPTFLADYRPPKVAPGVAHPLGGGVDDIKTMFATARRPHHKAMVVLIGLLGLRISEARNVRYTDFDDGSGEIVLTVRGKGDKTRHVPVDPDVMAMLDEPFRLAQTRDDGLLIPIGDRPARRAWTRIGRRAGIARPTATHDGRMTFGTAAYDKHKDLRAVQELLGHSSSSTTENYTGVSMAKKRASAAVL